MNNKYRMEQLIFLGFFYLASVMMLISDVDSYSIVVTLRKIKYLYIIYALAVLFIKWSTGFVRKSKGYIIIFILAFHSVLFGYFFVNQSVIEETHKHAQQMLWFYLTVFVTYGLAREYYLMEEILLVSFWASFTQIMIQAIVFHGEFVNPIWGLVQTFAGENRYKVTFGFTHAGWTSNACYLLLVLTFFYYKIVEREKKLNKKIYIFGIASIVGIMMIIAAAERSGILAVVLFIGVEIFFEIYTIYLKRNPYILISLLLGVIVLTFLLIGFGTLDYVIQNSNRMDNIAINYPAFKQIGNIWTGMGFVESSGFQDSVQVYGVATFSLDMYYPYIFFTTGIIGSVIIFGCILYLSYRLITNWGYRYRRESIALLISNLFFAIFQTNLFTYRYATSFFILLLLLLACDTDKYGSVE